MKKLVLCLIVAVSVFAKGYIVVDAKSAKEDALQKDANRVLHKNIVFSKTNAGNKTVYKSQIINDDKNLALLYMSIKDKYNDAVLINLPSDENVDLKQLADDKFVYIALFILAFVAIIGLFVSSKEIDKVKKESKKLLDKQDEIREIQDKILQNLSQNIHSMAIEAVNDMKELILRTQDETALKKVQKAENILLNVSNNLLEFLRIKSKKVQTRQESFSLFHFFNDVTGQVSATDKNIDFDLLYDVDKSVPNTLMGDTLNLTKILVNLIDFFKQNGAKSVLVEVARVRSGISKSMLAFRVRSDLTIDIQNDKELFVSKFNETTKQYEGLQLYVAKQLSVIIDAELIPKNSIKNKNAEFILKLPFSKPALSELIHPKELIKELYEVNVLLVDKNKNCLDIDRKIFENIGIKVDGYIRREFNHSKVDFGKYDIAIIEDSLFTQELKTILFSHKNLKVISFNSIFVDEHIGADVSDAVLKRPLTVEQIQETFNAIYESKEDRIESKNVDPSVPVYKGIFPDTKDVTLDSFADFAGKNLLIVEDNFINQKVLLSILKKSDMKIEVANDGKEALEKVEADPDKFDLVLMDINMPIMDGYTATIKIREITKTLPIISQTALTSPDEVRRMYEVGMNGFLAKPVGKDKLYTVFALFMDIDKSRTPAQILNQDKPKQLDKLPGLDIKQGLENSDNDELLYKEVLEEFLEAFGESDVVFENLVYDYRFEQLRLMCIDIRGVAGSIGAKDMYDLVVEILQMILIKKYNTMDVYQTRFKKELQRLKDSINIYLSSK